MEQELVNLARQVQFTKVSGEMVNHLDKEFYLVYPMKLLKVDLKVIM